jgi:hypothetical protein
MGGGGRQVCRLSFHLFVRPARLPVPPYEVTSVTVHKNFAQAPCYYSYLTIESITSHTFYNLKFTGLGKDWN